jgi:hypothetical protein
MLAAATLAVVASAGVMLGQHPADDGGLPVARPFLPDLGAHVNEVARLEIASAKGQTTVVRDAGGGWRVASTDGYRANVDQVKALVVGLAEARALEPRTARPDLYPRLGVEEVDAPASTSLRVALGDEAGRDLAAVIVGKPVQAGIGGGAPTLYARRAGEAGSWLIQARLGTPESVPQRWLDRSMPRLARERVLSVTLRQPDGSVVTVTRSGPGARDFTVTGLPAGAKVQNQAVDETVGALSYLTFEDVARAEGPPDPAAGPVAGPVAEVRSLDGLVIQVCTVRRDGRSRVTLDFAFDDQQAGRAGEAGKTNGPGEANGASEAGGNGLLSPVEAQAQVADWQARFSGWSYTLYDAAAEAFTRPPAGFVAPEAPPGPP